MEDGPGLNDTVSYEDTTAYRCHVGCFFLPGGKDLSSASLRSPNSLRHVERFVVLGSTNRICASASPGREEKRRLDATKGLRWNGPSDVVTFLNIGSIPSRALSVARAIQ